MAIDDHCRIAYTAMLPNEKASSSTAFFRQAVAYFAHLGIRVPRILTANGPCFYAHRFAQTCPDLQLLHIQTLIYTPRTSGKAQRFIQTAIPRVGLRSSLSELRRNNCIISLLDPTTSTRSRSDLHHSS